MTKMQATGVSHDDVSTYFARCGPRDGRARGRARTGVRARRGSGAGSAVIAAEEADFTWDARHEERWLGSFEPLEDSDFELDRVAMIGRLDRRWCVAVCIVDGDGLPHGMIGRRTFTTVQAARSAFAALR